MIENSSPHINTVLCGDNATLIDIYPDGFFDAIITDFPYGLGNKEPSSQEILQYLSGQSQTLDTSGDIFREDWQLPSLKTLRSFARVLKPGGYFLTFSATRTQDIISLSLRCVGLENRDVMSCHMGPPILQWMYAQGIPKNFDLGRVNEAFKGLGTSLKPAWEPVLVFRKPIPNSTLTEHYEKVGTGPLRIEASRLSSGRYPSNVILVHTPWCEEDGTETIKTSTGKRGGKDALGKLQDPNARWGLINTGESVGYGDQQGNETVRKWRCPEFCPSRALNEQEPHADRYFYTIAPEAPFRFTSKATKSQKHEGLPEGVFNVHVTPKPIALMEYLVALVCRPGSRILDPYCGSGSTLVAAQRARCDFVGMDVNPDYVNLSRLRVGEGDSPTPHPLPRTIPFLLEDLW